ncbi:metallophosphoesterase [Afifella sp. IM 167]|uniref:metallophosphoesterase family protein n=1 Tax=Afifella sp. IM 167 TaxID=2033586 RepID=UPI001CCC632A|nr:metallophosphoesterase [Afifella sp. IM 167]MBZ8132716.1 serine/threonine protein phosphatase [Afifella sp. IM 167]
MQSDAREAPLFRFAIISDTHIRPQESDDSSPWTVNSYANGRARRTVSLLRALDPEFVIHLGDMVHPLPSLPSYASAVAEAKEIFAPLEAPLHLIPGNHDIGDKPMPGLPAAPVDAASVAEFRKNFGEDYRSFEHKSCRFIFLNAEIINTGLPDEAKQKAWLEGLLAEPYGGRSFVFIHYPPFIHSPDEPSNYDNLDEPGRSWLLSLLAGKVEAVFAGHVHNFFYNRHEGFDSFILPALSFVRQDYSELFRGGPGKEFGRDDAGKLGFFIADVFADRIALRLVRTQGIEESKEEAAAGPAAAPLLAGGKAPAAALGVHLRHNWAEVVKLPYNGPMDEFLRKEARNDYHLLALMEAGTRMLRIPLRDLEDPAYLERIGELHRMGFRFTAFHFGLPGERQIALLEKHAGLVDTFETIISWKDREAFLEGAAGWRGRLSARLSLTRVESSAEKKVTGTAFSHYVSYGFGEAAFADVETFARAGEASGLVDAYVFSLAWADPLAETVASLRARAAAIGTKADINIRLASENPAELIDEPAAVAGRVAEAVALAHAYPDTAFFLDTFIDMERGYFPRLGLYDRRLNPTLAGQVYRNLSILLGDGEVRLGEAQESDASRLLPLSFGKGAARLVLPKPAVKDHAGAKGRFLPQTGWSEAIDLATGETIKSGSGGAERGAAGGPVLIMD